MSLFFISYKHEDVDFAREVKNKIGESGFLGWIDLDIRAGDEWKIEIDTAIRNSLGLILIVTPAALGSQYVTYEWSSAIGLGKQIIPIILRHPRIGIDEPQMHPRLGDRQYLDFSDSAIQPWDDLLEDLAELRSTNLIPPEIKKALDGLIESYLPSDRQAAVQTLLEHPHPKAGDALAAAVGHGIDEVSVQAALALAQKSNYEDTRAIPGLDRGLTKKNYTYNGKAVSALGQYRTNAAVQVLQNAYDSELTEETKKEVFEALSKLADPSSEQLFREVVESTTWPSRKEVGLAAKALATMTAANILPHLVTLLKREDEWAPAKVMVIEAIGILGDPEGIEPLKDALQRYSDPHRQVPNSTDYMKAIVEALIELGGQISIDYLRQLQAKTIPFLRGVITQRLPR